MSDSFATMSPSPVDPARIDQQWQLLKLERNEVASAFQSVVRKIQTGDAGPGGWLNDLEALTAQVRKEQGEMQSLMQLLHDFATQSHHALAGHQAAAPAQSAPPTGGVDPYAVVPDVIHAAPTGPAVDYAVVPDVIHAAPTGPAVDYAVVPDVIHAAPTGPAIDYAVVMDHPNRNEPIPPWYTQAQAGSGGPGTQPGAAPARPPADSEEE